VLDNATTITKFELIDSDLYRYILYGNNEGLGNQFTRITTLNWSSEAYTTPIPYKYIVILLKKTDNSTFTTAPCVKVYGNAQTLPQRVSTLEQEVASMPDTALLEEKFDAVTEGEFGRMLTSNWTLGYIWNLSDLSQSANARGEISGEYISTSDNLTIKFTDWDNCNIQMIQYQSESVHYAQAFTTEQAFNQFFVTRPNRAGYKYKFGIYYKSSSATMTEGNRRDGVFTFQDGAGTLTAIDSVARGADSELVYIEIGDSITYLADNKYETSYDDTGTTQTGYKGWGYGRYLCNAMGISYANHYPQGANGRNFAAYYEEWQAGHWSFPNDPDIVTIELGTNDWGTMHYKLGTQADYINNTYVSGYSNANCTMYGAMRKLVDKVRSLTTGTKVPQIAFISPLQRGAFVYASNTSAADQYGMIFTKSPIKLGTNGYEYVANTPEYFPSDGFTLKDVYDAIKWVCEYEGFTFVDFFTDSIVPKKYLRMEQEDSQSVADEVRANTFVKQDILRDNLHPTDKGFQLMGCRVIEALRKLFYDRMVERQ
jgi:lysophospholipase L1-like esterase